MASPGGGSDRFRLAGAYERLRRALRAAPSDGRLERSLSYWVLPTDRSLPLVLLDKSLGQLLEAEFAEVMQTPGVGQKKLLGLFELMRRALKADDTAAPFGLPTDEPTAVKRAAGRLAHSPLDNVSEAVWEMWAESVRRAGLESRPLGRVAPSLRPLPTVIWDRPLGDYATLTLAEVRRLKTHGEKRVRAVLGVFHAVHEAVSTAVLDANLQLDFLPRFVPETNTWLTVEAVAPGKLSAGVVEKRFVRPLIEQVEQDLGEQEARLAADRIGVHGAPPAAVQQLAKRLRVTRARVYQLLDDCARMAAVRWPEGRWLAAPLVDRPGAIEGRALALINNTRAVFFP
ncbi:MAG: hypothetical protein AAFV43_10825 [Planctomycetota bacterium]